MADNADAIASPTQHGLGLEHGAGDEGFTRLAAVLERMAAQGAPARLAQDRPVFKLPKYDEKGM